MTEQLHFDFSLLCIGGGNGNPLQCSCLENPMDRGAWWAAVYGVAQSWTRLKRLSSSSSSSLQFAFSLMGFSSSTLYLLCKALFFFFPTRILNLSWASGGQGDVKAVFSLSISRVQGHMPIKVVMQNQRYLQSIKMLILIFKELPKLA